MEWYLAKLVFSIEVESDRLTDQPSQFDQQWRLIQAGSQPEAHLKARSLGKKEECSFPGSDKRVVHWRFVEVNEVLLLGDLRDGMQIYSDTVETHEKEEFILSVMTRSLGLISLNKNALQPLVAC